MIPREWITEAAERIKPLIARTPTTFDPDFDLFIKWENHQTTGSFKLRGALNKVLALQPWEVERGLVTASAGNHGQGVAWAANRVGAQVTVFASDQAVPAKLEAMRTLGADVRLVPGGYAEAERTARKHAEAAGATWVSPYNDGQVIAGQGTIGLEMLAQGASRVKAWVVPVGGGGLISGISAALAGERMPPALVGVQSEASPFFHALFHTGTQEGVREFESLADGLSGEVEDGSLTIPIVRSRVQDFVLVSETSIAQAMAYAWRRYNEVIEGSAAAALAAVLTGEIAERPAAVVISGGNVDPQLHRAICSQYTGEELFQ
ncbi:MAG TPA: pyridoxal-phosphate dependent enzyme [Anaerolineaceae bacterium]|nr:pyridoxal-phosphate dependent enzyme [Anaerolineaceae bacterium]